jgi:hypothetical protein
MMIVLLWNRSKLKSYNIGPWSNISGQGQEGAPERGSSQVGSGHTQKC